MIAAVDYKQDILPEILSAYDAEDIFNADETGLYYHGLPDRGHCVKRTDSRRQEKGKASCHCTVM